VAAGAGAADATAAIDKEDAVSAAMHRLPVAAVDTAAASTPEAGTCRFTHG
jgi:hypothetical protein